MGNRTSDLRRRTALDLDHKFSHSALREGWDKTGIMTFMTSSDGVVYERDLGPDTAKITASIQAFNPSDDWLRLE